eukprot:3591840-Pleurochrysis_carterae.AAC.2
MLCRAMSCPTDELFAAARRVLMYLAHHKRVGLRYVTVNNDAVHGASDSDIIGRRATRRRGTCFCLTAPRYRGLRKGKRWLAYLHARRRFSLIPMPQRMLFIFGPCSRSSVCTRQNMPAINLAYNPEHHAHTKPIDRRQFFT